MVVPDQLPELIAVHAAGLGARVATLYLADYEQVILVPVPRPGRAADEDELVIDTTLAGRAYRDMEMLRGEGDHAEVRLWVPVVDGTERLGLLQLVFPSTAKIDEDFVAAFAALVAELVTTKNAYGDLFQVLRRRRPMTVAAELAWQLLPPLTFGTDRVVIAGGLVPVYEIGGDSFDYGADARTARVAVFDAMGHGLEAGLLATVAVATYRNCRRQGRSLAETEAAIDEELAHQFGSERFVTAVLAELDLDSGQLQLTLAGHPPPLLFRGGRFVKALAGDPGAPLGLGLPGRVLEEVLEPGDQVVLYTDGVIEARDADGQFFGLTRLVDLVERASRSGNPAPEALRRLVQAIVGHQASDFQDDATLVLLEWQGNGGDPAAHQPGAVAAKRWLTTPDAPPGAMVTP